MSKSDALWSQVFVQLKFPNLVISAEVTNLLVVLESDISSAVRVTAHVLEFTEVTASVGVASFFQLLAVLYGSALNI